MSDQKFGLTLKGNFKREMIRLSSEDGSLRGKESPGTSAWGCTAVKDLLVFRATSISHVLDKQTLTVLPWCVCSFTSKSINKSNPNYRKEIGHVSYPVKQWEKQEMLAQEYSENINSRMTITKSSAAAAKSLQSCLTLCDPIAGSPPGSPVPGILQARTMEWVAISFS